MPRGVAQHTIWLIFGMIVLVLTVALFYVIMPHSDCDRLAKLSAQEIKSAIECVAKYPDGINPVTGEKCNVAIVRLCQEDKFSIFGIGFVQAYLGLMVPEYMIYYQKFPTQKYKTLFEGPVIGFTESYPFERAYVGQRPYDIRPTLTQFKQFFKTKYLQKPCTSEKGLCFNIRGREEVILIDADIVDVRLEREGLDFAETNPKFYLVAPCYAKVVFKKGDDGKIYARPMRIATPGASNYCYADEIALSTLISAYANEIACEAALLALDFLTAGGKAAVEKSAEASIKVTAKAASKAALRKISKKAVKLTLKRFGKELGKEAQEAAAKEAVKLSIKHFLINELEEEVVKDATSVATRRAFRVMHVKGFKFSSKGLIKTEEELIQSISEQSAKRAINVYAGKKLGFALKQTVRDALRKSAEYGADKTAIKSLGDQAEPILEKAVARALRKEFGLTEEAAAKAAKKGVRKISKHQSISKGLEKGFKRSALEAGIPEWKAEIAWPRVQSEALEGFIDAFDERIGSKLVNQITEEAVENFAALESKKVVSRTITSGFKARLAAHAMFKRYASMEGLPTKKADQLLMMFSVVPCVDIDICRAAAACVETSLWPGMPFEELTDAKMKGVRVSDTVADVFYTCCNEYNYGAEKDPHKIMCRQPENLIELIKPELKKENITLMDLADYLGLSKNKIESACALTIGDNSKTCIDALEVRKLGLKDTCGDLSEHTYDFGKIRHAGQVTIFARLFEENCKASIFVELSNDTKNWIIINETAAEPYPQNNFIYIRDVSFRYLRLREDGLCYFDSSGVVIDPLASQVQLAEPNTRYELLPGRFNYFIVPEGFESKASDLCETIEHCTTIAKWLESEHGWLKWSSEGGGAIGKDFNILSGDKIGIYTSEKSFVIFTVG